jgi:hypothetical protein
MRSTRWSGCQIAGRELLVLKNNEQRFQGVHEVLLYTRRAPKSDLNY